MVPPPTEPRWSLSRHAYLRMLDMGLTRDQVIEVVDDPEVTYPSYRARGYLTSVKGDLAVGFDPINRVVVTVLHNGVEFMRPALTAIEAIDRIALIQGSLLVD